MRPLSREEDRRIKKILSAALLLALMAINGGFVLSGLGHEDGLFGTMLLGINVLTIGVVFLIFAIGQLKGPEDTPPIVGLVTTVLIGIVGTSVACVWLVSLVFIFSPYDYLPGSRTYASLACYSSVAILCLFVYYSYVHQYD